MCVSVYGHACIAPAHSIVQTIVSLYVTRAVRLSLTMLTAWYNLPDGNNGT